MENISALLALLRQSGVTLGLQGENLEIEVPEEGISDSLLHTLSASKKELVAYLRLMKDKAQEYTGIAPAPPALSYPLSSSQYRVWLTTELEGSTAAYNIPFIVELHGKLEPALLLQAICNVTERHEILRTVFRKDDAGEIRQWILENSTLQPVYSDLRAVSNKQDVKEQLLSRWGSKIFDLENGPLLDVILLQPEDTLFIMALNIHHIICDGWSVEVLIRDIVKQYRHLQGAPDTDSGALSLQYKDYAVWQQEQLKNGSFNNHSDYWREKLSGPLPVLDLTVAGTRPAVKTYNGDTMLFSFSPAASENIMKWAHQKNGLLLMPLLAAVKAVLYRYSGQNDIIVGTPVAGRNHAALYDQIGFYVNTLPLRTVINGAASFSHMFGAVRTTLLEAMEHQEYPLDLMINDLEIKRDTSRAALFDVLVGLQNIATETLQAGPGDVSIKQVPLLHNKTKFDMTVMFRETGNQITFYIDYNTDIYTASTIARLGEHIITFLENAISDEEVPVEKINYLSDAERDHLVRKVNNTTRNYPRHETIVSLFEEQVKKFSDRIAVVCGQRQVTYRELDDLSSQLAHCLRNEYLVQEGDFVGIMIDRNEWLMISILAILKTGAAFVPFDSSVPEERNKLAREDSGCKVVIDQQLADRFLDNLSRYAATPVSVKQTSDAAAYLIYTSGTTGKPKGVITSHANIINYHYWFINAFGITHTDSSILLSSYVFSGVYTSVYCTILSGGTLHIVPRMFMQNTPELSRYIAEQGITFLKITPSHLDMLIHLGDFLELVNDRLRLLVIGGDRIKTADLQLFNERRPHTRLVYHYGASETTMGSLFHEITDANIEEFCRQPRLGKPIDNAGVFIVDNNRQLVPQGVVGQICVTGAGLSQGYLHNRELTDEMFFYPDFNPGARAYATGDMGKLLEDDTVAFMGRSDSQVKVRGHRIELAEIERVLLNYEGVNSAKVLPYDAGNGETELAAYVISPARLRVTLLREHLKKHVPEYMVPSRFSQLEAFPTGVTGKIDTKAFPAPSAYPMDSDLGLATPRNETEAVLLGIWKNVLGRNEIGIADNFFELGGHSLNFAILNNRYASELQVRLSMRETFTNATIAAHAKLVDHAAKDLFESVAPAPVLADYPLSNAQQRLWMICQFHSAGTAFNIPVACVFKGNLNLPAFEQSLHAIIERHEVLRTTFRMNKEGEVRQAILSGPEFDFRLEYHDLSNIPHNAAILKEKVQKERTHLFRIDAAPLLRAALFKTAASEFVFSIVIHHIICDRWSMNILIKELMFLYRHIDSGTPYQLPALKIQYKDYAVWQRRLLENHMLESSRDYWRRQLSGDLPGLNLRSQLERPALMSYNGATVRTVIREEQYAGFLHLLHQQHGTLFTGLTSITAMVLHHFSGQQHLLIGAPFAGRSHADLEDQVGFYVNMLPLSIRLAQEDTFITLHQKVKTVALEANQHQIYPLDELVDQLGIQRDTSRGALFDVVVSLLDNQLPVDQREKGFGDLHVTNYTDVSVNKSRFDLLFNFEAAAGVLHMDINYNTDLFTEGFINDLIDTFSALMRTVIAHPLAGVNEVIFLKDLLPAGSQDGLQKTVTAASSFINDLSEFNF
ncbi:non-ribosomal peptide synthetase [Chitinophaga sp. S165]|uniref:non-ribosomal peptide synthetase n=1 Tax=Chitinophaga sp. S165 TaxID=2135462 RepID=UPI000D70CAAE|nr:non-ribosomal peptide synthetase [Chitinophaga sp. S165]PWV46104.1 amino acid adenylation domain-containing protein [Chitinophaga sp. S165]